MQTNSIRLVKTIGISSAAGLTGVLLQMHLLQFQYDADIPLYSWPIETLLAYHKVLSFPGCPTSLWVPCNVVTLKLCWTNNCRNLHEKRFSLYFLELLKNPSILRHLYRFPLHISSLGAKTVF